MTEIHTFAILYPAAGKAQRMRDLLVGQCKHVHEKEDYTLRFLVTEPIDAKTEEFIMFETYKSEEANEKHGQEPHFKECYTIFQEEGLMAKPPYLVRTVSKAGFDRDRTLIWDGKV